MSQSDHYHLMYKYKKNRFLPPKNDITGGAGGAVGSGQAVRRPTPRNYDDYQWGAIISPPKPPDGPHALYG